MINNRAITRVLYYSRSIVAAVRILEQQLQLIDALQYDVSTRMNSASMWHISKCIPALSFLYSHLASSCLILTIKMTLTLRFAAAGGRSSQYQLVCLHAAELHPFLALAAAYHNQATTLQPVQLDCLVRVYNVV